MFRGVWKLYRWPVLLLIAVFVLGVILGLFLPVFAKLWLLEAVATKFETILASSASDWSLSFNIFLNNLFVSFIMYVSGFFLIVPFLIVLSNGVIIGVFLSFLYRTDVLLPGNFLSSLAGLLPHGIFELAAFFLVGALSIVVTIKLMFPQHVEPKKKLRTVLLESVERFVLIVLPLLLFAAVIETFVSPQVSFLLNRQWYQEKLHPQLAVPLNMITLVKEGCVMSVTGVEENAVVAQNSATLIDSLLSIAQTVYDEQLYRALQQRRQASFWKETWFCPHNASVQIQSWSAVQWSKDNAAGLIEAILKRSEIVFKEYRNKERVRFIYTVGETTIAQTITKVGEATVAITQTNPTFTVNELLIQKP